MQPYKLVVLPFLHERKIYLTQNKPKNKYFYTYFEEKMGSTVTNKIIMMDITNHKIIIYSEGGLLYKRIDYKQYVDDYG